MPSSTMKAIKMVSEGQVEIQEAAIPEARGDWVLVKVTHIALNPTDWKHIDYMPSPGATVGCDYAGIVEAAGSECKRQWKKGERIAGVGHGSNALDHQSGVFAEYALIKEGMQFKVPDNISDEEAATFGVAFVTVGLSLYQQLALPLPGSVSADAPILIYGGSTATGTIAIQFAKLSGAKVITTCSARNFDLVKSVGADEVFDYNDPECAKKVRSLTEDSLHTILDCAGGETGTRICSESMSSKGGQICTIVPGAEYTSENTRVKPVVAYSSSGEPFSIAGHGNPVGVSEDYLFASFFGRLAERLLQDGKIKGHPRKVREGLENAVEGLDEMRKGEVSGVKLVYRI